MDDLKGKLVEVTWHDTEDPTKRGWLSGDEVREFAETEDPVHSIGWVQSDTKLYITLVADKWESGDTFSRVTKIPRGFIKGVRTIE